MDACVLMGIRVIMNVYVLMGTRVLVLCIYILEMQINTINALQVSKSITYNLHSGVLEVQKTPAVDSPTANLNLFTFCEGIERVREEPGVCYSL